MPGMSPRAAGAPPASARWSADGLAVVGHDRAQTGSGESAFVYVRVWPGLTGSGPAPASNVPGRSGLPSDLTIVSPWTGGAVVTFVLTAAELLFSSFDSAIC